MSLSPFSDHFNKPSTLHTTRIFFNTTVRTANLPFILLQDIMYEIQFAS